MLSPQKNPQPLRAAAQPHSSASRGFRTIVIICSVLLLLSATAYGLHTEFKRINTLFPAAVPTNTQAIPTLANDNDTRETGNNSNASAPSDKLVTDKVPSLANTEAHKTPVTEPHEPALKIADAQQMQKLCERISGRLGSVKLPMCTSAKLRNNGYYSTNGFPLSFTDSNTALVKDGKPPHLRVLLIGGIHGDELSSVSIVFRWLQWAAEGKAAAFQWRFAPIVNPDGLLQSPPSRTNANGVDLNRNFASPDWDKSAIEYWEEQARKDPRRFPGKSAVSELETRWIQEQIEEYQPNVIVSIHAPYGILDFDGPANKPKRFGMLSLNQLGIYPGSLGNYGGVYKNIPVVTIELPSAGIMPTEKEMHAIWNDMLTWLERNSKIILVGTTNTTDEKVEQIPELSDNKDNNKNHDKGNK